MSAAWGEPPVTLRCGVFATPTPLGQVVILDGLEWSPVTGGGAVTWTTVGRRVEVQVRVPTHYDNQGPLLADLSPIIIRTLPKPS